MIFSEVLSRYQDKWLLLSGELTCGKLRYLASSVVRTHPVIASNSTTDKTFGFISHKSCSRALTNGNRLSRGGDIIPRTSQLDLGVRLSPHPAPDVLTCAFAHVDVIVATFMNRLKIIYFPIGMVSVDVM